jgi:hypothetical protein
MRKQPKLFGGSVVRGPAARPAVRLSLFDGAEWLRAAQEWAAMNGLEWGTFTVGKSFHAGGCWYTATWAEDRQVWEFDQLIKGA